MLQPIHLLSLFYRPDENNMLPFPNYQAIFRPEIIHFLIPLALPTSNIYRKCNSHHIIFCANSMYPVSTTCT